MIGLIRMCSPSHAVTTSLASNWPQLAASQYDQLSDLLIDSWYWQLLVTFVLFNNKPMTVEVITAHVIDSMTVEPVTTIIGPMCFVY